MDKPSSTFYDHSTGQRVNTDAAIIPAIRAEHPTEHITVIPVNSANLLQYASSGEASAIPVDEGFKDPSLTTSLKWRLYIPPVNRINSPTGSLTDYIHYGKYRYIWENHEFTLYYVNGRDGTQPYGVTLNQYLVGGISSIVDTLTLRAGKYTNTLHNEVWVFDQGRWQKNANLWTSVQKARWENVILDETMKKDLITGFSRFYDSRSVYEKLGVPWKRGVIFHGPPGNGKTISIKATMHMLYSRTSDPIPTLYVKTLAAFMPPEFSLGEIFRKARQEAPCFLVFEDLDSVVSDRVRSFFLNEVDGLSTNDGILIVGSTNHLELLDPGISKRPSRFDRKYLFPNPNRAQREKYCHYWQGKLKDNQDVPFPDRVCVEIAKITGGFSFAFIQEAFVASLLVIAGGDGGVGDEDGVDGEGVVGTEMKERAVGESEEWEVVVPLKQDYKLVRKEDIFDGEKDKDPEEPDLGKYILWVEIKKQIELLRKELA